MLPCVAWLCFGGLYETPLECLCGLSLPFVCGLLADVNVKLCVYAVT